MQLTRFTDYSLRVLIYAGLQPDEWVTIKQISEAYEISRNHLMKVVSFLTQSGYLVSQRGPGGGVKLQRPGNEIILADVILDAEGELHLIECLEEGSSCVLSVNGGLKYVMTAAVQAFIDTLRAHTLDDIIEPREQLESKLGIAVKAA